MHPPYPASSERSTRDCPSPLQQCLSLSADFESPESASAVRKGVSRRVAVLAALLVAGTQTPACLAQGAPSSGPEAPVVLTRDGALFHLSNGEVTAAISTRNGDLVSLKYHGLETMGRGSGHPAGYWEQAPSPGTATVTIDPASNGGERAEVSVKGPIRGFVLEIRYSMGRSDHGLYTYAVFDHPGGAAAALGESRFGAKLNGAVFDWLSIDRDRNGLMPTGDDWDHGDDLNMKEARRLTTGRFAGREEHKYDYSACQSRIPAFGWSSTHDHIGLFFINPSMEFLSGGPTKYELTGHLDDNEGGDPTLLDYWRSSHYGGSEFKVADGENYRKVVGPILVYVNSGGSPDEMFQDALEKASDEAAKWPYAWVSGVDYPDAPTRGRVRGHLVLNDPLAPIPMKAFTNLQVGLAYPDDPVSHVTWQIDAKHYQFWVKGGSDGRFDIPKVRPGTYQLHAIADGVLGEFSAGPVVVGPGGSVSLGDIVWRPVRYGRQLWDIGIANREGSEFFQGDNYFHWGMYLKYSQLFPNDVDYTIGRSDFRKDWYFEQVPHISGTDRTGRSRGRETPWRIHFDLAAAPQGRAILRLALAGTEAKSIEVEVNGRRAGAVTDLPNISVLHRDGIAGVWQERTVAFDASMMKAGSNEMTLTIPGGLAYTGIIYDYLRLELAPPAAAGRN